MTQTTMIGCLGMRYIFFCNYVNSDDYIISPNSVSMVKIVFWAVVSQLKGGKLKCAVSMGGIT